MKPFRIPYGFGEIVPQKAMSGGRIRCHIRECSSVVRKPTSKDKDPKESLCKTHGIYVHSTTYRYEDWHRNLLWPGDDARADWFAEMKREGRDRGRDSAAVPGPWTRMANENSEDAVTWNVFRTLERGGALHDVVSASTGIQGLKPDDVQMYLWTLDYAAKVFWEPFQEASWFFGEASGNGTETDVILHILGKALVFIEAKFGSPNEREKPLRDRYKKSPWFRKAMRTTPAGHYQLARNWLLGTYMATQGLSQSCPFWLVSLVREGDEREKDLASEFYKEHCVRRDDWMFTRMTWEKLAGLASRNLPEPERTALERYVATKTLNLKKAFSTNFPA